MTSFFVDTDGISVGSYGGLAKIPEFVGIPLPELMELSADGGIKSRPEAKFSKSNGVSVRRGRWSAVAESSLKRNILH